MSKTLVLSLLAVLPLAGYAQSDTLKDKNLDQVTVKGYRLMLQSIERLSDVHGTYLTSGKKTEVINVKDLNANVSEKTGRQVFAKIPGVFVYDMDGSGNQLNISTRGLDPHRSWEYNMRYNGVITNSDMYGYPASHFSAPLEAIERIEMVRGGGGLQYGAQFGGMINYVAKSADTTRKIGFEQYNTVGAYGLLSNYSAVGGKIGRMTYYAYYNRRVSDGYRDNAGSRSTAYAAQIGWEISNTLSLKAGIAHSEYVYQLPGPLTDAMFAANPRQSTRSRNYYSPDIYVPSLQLDWKPAVRTHVSLTVSGVFGTRNSVMFDRFATVPDTFNNSLGSYNPRQVDIDRFNSRTAELRILQRYHIGPMEQAVVVGVQYMNNDMSRRQQGKGTTGSDFDLTLVNPNWGRDLRFATENVAFFVENTFNLSKKLSVSPGFRMESGKTDATGSISYYNPEDVPNEIRHQFPLLGVSAKYQMFPEHQMYANWSQAYRPVIFKDIIPGSILERADKDLKDAKGYSAEWGMRGKGGKWFRYDVNGFFMRYNNRMGNLVQQDPVSGENYIYKTNIGDSHTWGLEMYAEAIPLRTQHMALSIFSATAYLNCRYLDAAVSVGSENTSVKGNRVEGVPDWISRNGATLAWKKLSATLLYSYVGQNYADALNTVEPSANGAKGLVPAYGLVDFYVSYRVAPQLLLRGGISNLTDESYFTKRPTFYPGPGIWPSDGRGWQVSVQWVF